MNGPVVLAVVSDTHVPDRVEGLHPNLLPALRAAAPARILHAGDISRPVVLRELERIAPTTAVGGNRDFTFFPPLSLTAALEVNGVRIALLHGHGGWRNYLVEKWQYMTTGYAFDRVRQNLMRYAPGAQVYVYGHTHHAEARRIDGVLFFNPGSASFRPALNPGWPSFGLLRVHPGGHVETEIVPLTGWRVENRRWVETA